MKKSIVLLPPLFLLFILFQDKKRGCFATAPKNHPPGNKSRRDAGAYELIKSRALVGKSAPWGAGTQPRVSTRGKITHQETSPEGTQEISYRNILILPSYRTVATAFLPVYIYLVRSTNFAPINLQAVSGSIEIITPRCPPLKLM